MTAPLGPGPPRLVDLVRAEVLRALTRRAVRVLLAIALIGTVAFSIITFLVADEVDEVEGRRAGPGIPARVVDLWPDPAVTEPNVGQADEDVDAILVPAMIFLFLGALIGGATVAGAEWESRSIETTLLREPRRARVVLTKLAVSGALAAVIGVGLLLAWSAAWLPTPVVKGDTAGVDAPWLRSWFAALVRAGMLAGGCAVVAGAIATIARRTVAAFVTVFAVISIGEPIVRGLRPSWQEWMILENLGNVMLAGAENIMERSTLGSFATLTLYLAAVVAVAVVSTTRRDIV
ncbi:MAG TPA: hypothetical protein VGA13_03555 [Acidimicrobiales bacterium]